MPSTNAKDAAQRTKLAHSYNEILDEFSAKELRSVGNYTLGKFIGKGSFGKVYLATHKLTNGTKVVLKSTKKDDANLAREIHHHRQFIHPHIARLYEVVVTESLVWLVLEYCSGDELYHHLLQHGRFDPPKAQKIFAQLVGAVSYVHQKSCVHRDLKLENILLDKNENVKLVDFGFTREYEGKSSYLQTWCGTVCYSAPEMLKGEKYAGEKVDVWSLGIILYALLSGELPFDEDDEEASKNKILSQDPVYPAHIPDEAKDLMSRLLSKRPLLRPSLADVMQHPWLSEHAAEQQEILRTQQPLPFTTDLEKDTLQKMRNTGVDIDAVIENVLAQRCDALAGWWALLLDKEERKARRRERKKREREAQAKILRRLSAASSRMDRLGPVIREADEEEAQSADFLHPAFRDRGRSRSVRRSLEAAGKTRKPSDTNVILPQTDDAKPEAPKELPRPPTEQMVDKQTPALTPPIPTVERDGAADGQELQLDTQSKLHNVPLEPAPTKSRFPNPILSHLAILKRWIKDPRKRGKGTTGVQDARSPARKLNRHSVVSSRRASGAGLAAYRYLDSHMSPTNNTSAAFAKQSMPLNAATMPAVNSSLSPLTPHSSTKRMPSGLRGRKSTSSSISSTRSNRYLHSHTRASSASSGTTSIASPTTSAIMRLGRSPHNSVKVLPSTPTTSSFPSNIRLVRAGNSHGNAGGEAGAAFSSLPPPSPGLIFARRKRSPFKGPTLSLAENHGGVSGRLTRGKSGSRSGSVPRRRSGELVIEEEDEDLVEDEDEGVVSSDHAT